MDNNITYFITTNTTNALIYRFNSEMNFIDVSSSIIYGFISTNSHIPYFAFNGTSLFFAFKWLYYDGGAYDQRYMTYIGNTDLQFSSNDCTKLFYSTPSKQKAHPSELKYCENQMPNCDIFKLTPTQNLTVTSKYTKDFNLLFDGEIIQRYNEVDVTECIWPRQDIAIENCTSNINFNLESSYTLNVGTNIDKELTIAPFSNCINAKLLIRACDYNTSNKSNCNNISWISIDQISETARISTLNISAANKIDVGFQAQKYTFVESPNTFEDISTNLHPTTFIFLNSLPKLNTIFSEKYIVYGTINNVNISFIDNEEDTTLIKVNFTSGLNVFTKSTSIKGEYTIIYQAANLGVSVENLTIFYGNRIKLIL